MEQRELLGYRRENGRVGVRNHVVILPVDDISNAACEPGVRSSSAARSRSISSRTRARSIAAEVVAMHRNVRLPAAARRAVIPPREASERC